MVREAPTLRPAPEGEEEWFALPLAAHARRRRRSLAAVGLDALKAQSPR